MNRDRLSRHLLIAFLFALILYAVGFWLIEARRVRHTPWQVAIAVDPSGCAKLEICQKSLGLGPVEIRLGTAAASPPHARTNILFKEPQPVPFNVPAGRCVFTDLTFLPGTVALNMCGTDIQMLPRALTIGTNEFSWRQTRIIEIQPDGTPRCVDH